MITQEVFGWQKAVEAETRREAQDAAIALAAARAQQVPIPIQPLAAPPAQALPPVAAHVEQDKSEMNKTDAVRAVLRQHATGLTPGDVWEAVKNQIGNRDYVYSILKRLKDSGQAAERRGKYFLREIPKSEEVREEPSLGLQ